MGCGSLHTIDRSTMSKKTRANKDPNKYAELHRLVRPHVDSFNYFVEEGIQQAVADLDPVEVTSSDGKSLTCILYSFVEFTLPYFTYHFYNFHFYFSLTIKSSLDRRMHYWCSFKKDIR